MNQDKKTVKPESTQGRMKNKVFQIRLKSNQEAKLNENFVGVVEQEFATKYLESLNIEPTQKNIMMILKSYPLKKCQISAGWNNAGMLADTITIVARKDKAKEVKIGEIDKKSEKAGKSFFSNEFVDEMKKVGLKTINIDSLYKNIQRSLAPPGQREAMKEDNEQRNDDDDGEVRKREYHDKRVFHVDFNLEEIKKKYLFPFNVTKEKRSKQPTKPMTAQNQVTLLTSNEFQFPFSVINVNVGLIKELQSPLNVTYEVIKIQIERFCNEFPFAEIFPTKKMTRKPTEKDIMMGDTDPEDDNPFMRQLNFLKKMLKSDTNIRFIGLNGHFCYWMVFGHTSPFELDSLFKKQILITLFEVLDALRDSFPSDYSWANFDFPFILLCLRMLLEYIFRTSYPGFFEKKEFAEITLESINDLLTKMYDPNNLFSRLVYLESEIKAVRKRNDEHIDESKMMKKRLFGVSPFMDMVIPNPAEGRVRSLFSMRKKQEVGDVLKPKGKRDESIGKTEMTAENEEKAKLEKVYDMRLLYVLLNRISNNVAAKIGNKASNIVSLPKVSASASHPNANL